MAVSEMQIKSRVRPVIADMETGLFKVVDALQKEALAIDVARVRSDFMQDLNSSLGQYRELRYFGDDNPEIRAVPPSQREKEKMALNRPVREVLKVVKYVQDNPRVTGEDLQRLKLTAFRNFPPHLNIQIIPILTAYGEIFGKLAEYQRLLQFDAEELPQDSILKARQPTKPVTVKT
jgi:hypothetical protein